MQDELAFFSARLLYICGPRNYIAGIASEYGNPLSLSDRRNPKYYPRALEIVFEKLGIKKSEEEIYRALPEIQLDEQQYEPFNHYSDDVCDVLEKSYDLIIQFIENHKRRIQIEIAHYCDEINAKQNYCWSSWLGGEDTIETVNWQELRGKEVIYCVQEGNEKSFATALHLLWHLNSTRHSVIEPRFSDGKNLWTAQEFENEAKNVFGLTFDKITEDAKDAVSSLDEFMLDENIEGKKIPYLLRPIITNRSITLLYAPPGIGKTWLTMCLASAISNGQSLFHNTKHFCITDKPYRVVYIDSEMGEYNFKKRLKCIEASYHKENGYRLKFKLVADLAMDLADEDGEDREQITQWLSFEAEHGRPVDFLILDNLSTLSGFNDSSKSWNNLFLWLKSLKEKKKHPCACIVVHHSNKKGDQRGSSAKVATVDNVLKMEKQEFIPRRGYKGLCFSLTIEKGRDMENIPEPFVIELLIPTAENTSGKFSCNYVNSSKTPNARRAEVEQYLKGEKIPPHAVIASLTGTTPETVKKLSYELQHESHKSIHSPK